MKIIASALIASAAFIATAATAVPIIGHVDGGYQNDSSNVTFVSDGKAYSDVKIIAVGGAFTGTEDLGAVAANGSVSIPFNNSGGAFSLDYDDYNGNGETSYRISATSGSHTYFSNVFSPSTNLSGTFVDFLGTGNDNDIGSVRVANVTGGVPEPTSWMLMVGGFGLVGFAARRRAATVAA